MGERERGEANESPSCFRLGQLDLSDLMCLREWLRGTPFISAHSLCAPSSWVLGAWPVGFCGSWGLKAGISESEVGQAEQRVVSDFRDWEEGRLEAQTPEFWGRNSRT